MSNWLQKYVPRCCTATLEVLNRPATNGAHWLFQRSTRRRIRCRFQNPRALPIHKPRMYCSMIRKIAAGSKTAEMDYRGTPWESRMATWNSAIMKRLYFIDSIREISSAALSDEKCGPSYEYGSIHHHMPRKSLSPAGSFTANRDLLKNVCRSKMMANVSRSEVELPSEDHWNLERSVESH